ncbi:MAG: ThuA domain-containing protein [Candidatus Marinimicrobia bacterium]|nr:ThuA domain-containing protein [Candidatus Neomarinimicrobiota bacterium]MCF7880638.1 ThuA domain-containing protein [Candidatus Neomarinimicrobiota bacterium]
MSQASDMDSVLIFTKTAGFEHESIPKGSKAMKTLLETNGFHVVVSDNDSLFNREFQEKFDILVFLNTTGDILNEFQQEVMREFVESGGGFVGIHAATDTEYEWEWYGEFIGTYFKDHPEIQQATIDVVAPDHPTTAMLPSRWERTDEWYNFAPELPDKFEILCVLDESTYEGGTHENAHPFTWCRDVKQGRMWYTAGGHTVENYQEEKFMLHLLAGIQYAGKITSR